MKIPRHWYSNYVCSRCVQWVGHLLEISKTKHNGAKTTLAGKAYAFTGSLGTVASSNSNSASLSLCLCSAVRSLRPTSSWRSYGLSICHTHLQRTRLLLVIRSQIRLHPQVKIVRPALLPQVRSASIGIVLNVSSLLWTSECHRMS